MLWFTISFLVWIEFLVIVQCIPRKVWLDPSGKQLLIWPVEELETLRDENVRLSNMELKQGDKIEVAGITAAQVSISYDTNIQKFTLKISSIKMLGA
jgi:hypothetical protein